MNSITFNNILGNNDNPSAEEFRAIYCKLLVCNNIVYKNNYGNCITNDTGILTVSSAPAINQCIVDHTSQRGDRFEIEFNYDEAIKEQIEKFDEHLNAFTAKLKKISLQL